MIRNSILPIIALILGAQIALAENIGVLVELTGNGAVLGNSCKQGVEMAYEEFSTNNKSTINLIFGDHRGDAKTGIVEFNKLINSNKVSAVIVMRSQVGMAVNPISRQVKIPLVGIVGHSKFLIENPYAFRAYPSTELEGKLLAEKSKQMGLSRVASISLEDEWTISLKDKFEKYASEQGQKIVFSETINKDEADFLPLITNLRKKKPDLIFVNLGVAQSGVFIKKLREQGLKQQIFTNFWASYPDVVKSAGYENIKNSFYVSVEYKPEFKNLFNKLFPLSSINEATVYCFSAFSLIAESLSAGFISEEINRIQELHLPSERIGVKDREILFNLILKKI